ncbi:hypothetical protein KR038_010579 [Drosophila bunnanda]|nr:hypothetical protein KR038_010579 [Drosophila bunnanda]
MTTFKIKAIPLVAKVLSLRRTTTNPQQQQQKQTNAQKDNAPQPSVDTPDPKEMIPPSKDGSLSKTEVRVNRRWEPYALYMNLGKVLLAVLVVCVLIGMFLLHRRGPKTSQESSVKVIMLWNEEPRLMPKGSSHMECGCVVTSRRKNYERAVDAIVFNAHRPYSLKYIAQINRTRDSLTVFAARNPLSLAKDPPLPPAGEQSLFNLTMTYRLDSHLVWSDYYFSLLNQAQRVNSFRAPSEHYADDMPGYEMQLVENKTSTKDRLAMYFIYEVEERSMPESLYLEELRNYVSLEAYESCVGFRCKHYYFMLIFDLTACPDYVPTQMYIAMHNYAVPVLIGGGNLNNLVPPHSYISSRDFPKPKDLVAHLNHLVKTPEEYKRYFWWHSLYKLRRNSVPYCQLCSYLQQPPKRRIQTSFAYWWATYHCPKQITTFL